MSTVECLDQHDEAFHEQLHEEEGEDGDEDAYYESDEDGPGHSHAISFVHHDDDGEGEEDGQRIKDADESANKSEDSGKS
eukprot:Em0016g357a